ncbi:MAG: efflux RND transporter periplasmic adaptor subunit [Desulfovermiculus sp.]
MNRFAKIVLGLIILSLGAGAAYYFIAQKPTVSRQKPQSRDTLVEVVPAQPSDAAVTITAMGTVVPSRDITLRTQVSGEIVQVAEHFTPGGRMQRGQTAVRIEPRDYEIEVHKAKSSLARTQADLRLEHGKQDVARQELDMFAQGSDTALEETDLALRRPQLEQARADVSTSRADLDKAELDLSRTRITAPFNAVITERSVNLGSQVSVQDSLATLVDTDTYWVRASIPVARLRFIDLSAPDGSPVRIISQSGTGEWKGRTLRLTGEVDQETRMATLIIDVPDPLEQQENGLPLMLNDYVRIQIQGRTLHDVIALPRRALREDQEVWVVKDGQLDIRPVHVAWKDREQVFIDQGLAPGDQVVLSDLPTPVQGMRLRVAKGGDSE